MSLHYLVILEMLIARTLLLVITGRNTRIYLSSFVFFNFARFESSWWKHV